MQWTERAHSRFRAASEGLVEAIRLYSEKVSALTGRRADYSLIFEAEHHLVAAIKDLKGAQFDLTGTFLPLSVRGEDDYSGDDDDDDGTNIIPASPARKISVMRRADYRVVEESATIAAGQAAYRTVWPQYDHEDAVADVTTLGRALYEILHAGGVSALADVAGIRRGRCVNLDS